MLEEIEIKRKVFKVIESLGKRTRKVERKGVTYFLKDFGVETKRFNDFIDGYNKLKTSGIRVPKVYMYDKSNNTVVTEFIEGKTVLDELLEHDLSEDFFEKAFTINWYAKKDKVSIDFDPKNFKICGDKMVYLPMTTDKYNEKWNFEKNHVVIWFYSREFVKYLKDNLLPIDPTRANADQGEINKKIALMVVKYYK